MSPITFFIPGIPKPQPRARSGVVRGKGGKPVMVNGRPIVRTYEAGTAENWKMQIQIAAKEHIPAQPLSGPVAMRCEFFFPRPKAHFRSNGELKPTAPGWHTSKGDIDNLWKALADTLTVLGMWQDDGQVCDCAIYKEYGGVSSKPGCAVTIRLINPTTEHQHD